MVSPACLIDMVISIIYSFCFPVLPLLSFLLSTTPGPLLSSPSPSRRQDRSSKGGDGWENIIIKVERLGEQGLGYYIHCYNFLHLRSDIMAELWGREIPCTLGLLNWICLAYLSRSSAWVYMEGTLRGGGSFGNVLSARESCSDSWLFHWYLKEWKWRLYESGRCASQIILIS